MARLDTVINAILAISKNGVIGDSNDLPWYLSADLIRFRKITTGNTVVMGRKTWQAIYDRIGKPLPDRVSVVLTRDTSFAPEGAVVVHNLEAALTQAEDVYVIGGAEIFQQALPYIQRLYLTEVEAELRGDTFLPAFDRLEWREVSRESHPADEKNEYPYTFLVFERKNEPRRPQ